MAPDSAKFCQNYETFYPYTSKNIKVYNCGPTVYKNPHLGNLRTYIFTDILIKTLKFMGFKTTEIKILLMCEISFSHPPFLCSM